jgi:hypothetical protein
MPGFATPDGLHDQDSWKLVRFIRHLPMITDEELAQMKDMNPKTPADLTEEEETKRFLEGTENPSSNETLRHH